MAITAGIMVGASIYESQKQGRAQKKAQEQSNREQKKAQDMAVSEAVRTARQNEMAEKAANARKPDLAELMADEQSRMVTGAGSTFLTGQGTGRNRGLLGGPPSLLGG